MRSFFYGVAIIAAFIEVAFAGQMPKKFLSLSGIEHYRSEDTYCYLNDYGKPRCLNPLDAQQLACSSIEGTIYCSAFSAGRPPPSMPREWPKN